MRTLWLVCCCVVCPLSGSGYAQPSPVEIGRVLYTTPEVLASFAQQQRKLKRADALYLGESLTTGQQGRLKLKLNDGSVLSLGAQTQMRLIEYANATDNRPALRLFDLEKGVFRAVTAKTESTLQFEVRTPVATIGVRGTDFWGGYLQADLMEVIMLSGHGVYVRSSQTQRELTRAGQGVSVSTSGQITPVSLWPVDKVTQAAATVSLPE